MFITQFKNRLIMNWFTKFFYREEEDFTPPTNVKEELISDVPKEESLKFKRLSNIEKGNLFDIIDRKFYRLPIIVTFADLLSKRAIVTYLFNGHSLLHSHVEIKQVNKFINFLDLKHSKAVLVEADTLGRTLYLAEIPEEVSNSHIYDKQKFIDSL